MIRRKLDAVIGAMHSYSVMYSHQTVGDDLRTVNRQWRVYEMAKALQGPPQEFVRVFSDKDEAQRLCNELNAKAILAAIQRFPQDSDGGGANG